MSHLDEELRAALRHEEPPPDLADRVLAHIKAQPAPKTAWWRVLWAPSVRWVAAAVAVSLLVAAGIEYRNQQQLRAEGDAAKARVMLALEIAGSKLHMAQKKVQELHE